MRRVAAIARPELLDIVRDHSLQPGRTLTPGEFQNSEKLFLDESGSLTSRVIMFQQHYLYYIGMKIAALVDDLFFSSKISATAKQVGSDIVFCRSAESVPADAGRICVDLNAGTFDPVEEIKKLKRSHPAPIVAFLSHVQVDLKRRAEEAGSDEVMPRSTFVQRLPEILS